MSHELQGELISLVGLVGRPIIDPDGDRVGKVEDVVVRWAAGVAHPPAVGILGRVGAALVLLEIGAVDVGQTAVHLRTSRVLVDKARRWPEHMALARDVLDHQLIDVGEVQVVRAADVYLVVRPEGLFLGGIEVSLRAYLRRALWSSRFRFNAPVRLIDWAELQAFAKRSVGERPPGIEESDDPTRFAGVVGGPVRLGVSAHELRTVGPAEIADLLRQLDRNSSSQLVALTESVSAAEALRSLRPDARQALMGALLPADRARLEALLEEEPRS